MTRAFVLLLLMLFTVTPTYAGEMRSLIVNGIERTYYVHVPATVKPGAPLVIFLHGAIANGRNDVHRYGWHHMADSHDFVVAGPDAPTLRANEPESNENFRTWNHGNHRGLNNVTASDDVGFIAAMIDDIARLDAIDRARVYVAGFSSGGSMAHRLGIELSTRIAAISASAGGPPPTAARPARGMPILITAGDRDPVTPVEGNGTFVKESHRVIIDRWRVLNGCTEPRQLPSSRDLLVEVSSPCRDGSEVRYIRMLGVDHIWPRLSQIDLTDESWKFFRRFRLTPRRAAPADRSP